MVRPMVWPLLGRRNLPALATPARLLLLHPPSDERLELRTEVGALEDLFADEGERRVCRVGAVPLELVCRGRIKTRVSDSAAAKSGCRRELTNGVGRPDLLQNDPDRVCESARVVRGVA